MSTIKVNTVTKRTGSTLTLGKSGTTIQMACGATQTGFGRTGTVDWCTTAKTSPLTGVSGNGYFINTTGGAVTVTLPASPSAGDIIAVKDYTGTAGTNKITIARNGSKIRSACACIAIEQNNAGTQLIYVDGTEGWQYFNCGSDGDIEGNYTVATGGTITESGDYKIHTFTSSSDFVVSNVGNSLGGGDKVSYMVIAGGGGGSRGSGGGGGAGGFREGKCTSDPYTASPLAGSALQVSLATFPITVGGAGAKSPNCDATGGSGSPSTFSTITSAGGGGGNMNATNPPVSPVPGVGIPGGSGGGGGSGSAVGPNKPVAGGTGNTPPVSPAQGTNGGGGSAVDNTGSGGGGGATVAGGQGGPGAPSPGVCGIGGNGGAGATTVITGSPVAYAGGGGGGSGNRPNGSTGGTGGGGNGGFGPGANNATAGGTNLGGGGGGGGYGGSSLGQAAGGSGIVVIRYKFQN